MVKLHEIEDGEFFLSEGELFVKLKTVGNYCEVKIIANVAMRHTNDGESRIDGNYKVNRVSFVLN